MQIKTKIVRCHTVNFKPVKQEVNGTVILPTLVFPGSTNALTFSITTYRIKTLSVRGLLVTHSLMTFRIT